jgi:hypothetical protein
LIYRLDFIYLSVFSIIVAFTFAQYDNVGSFGEYQEHWAMIGVEGKYGFIDNTGKEVTKPQ